VLTVGVLGAGGRVGRLVAEALADDGITVRPGARRPDLLGAAPGVPAVDAGSPDELSRFCTGCHVVVNCAGPSYRWSATVARAAVAAGAAYVDVGGDDDLLARLAAAPVPVLLGAGQSPGLSGLLPRWLHARADGPVQGLRMFAGGLERFTPAAAADMVASLHDSYGQALAAWRGGRTVQRALTPLDDVDLAPFPGRVTAHPFLTGEGRRTAGALGVTDGDFYNVFAGRRTLDVLNALAAQQGADPLVAGVRLIRAAEADLAGRRPYQFMVVELRDRRGWRTLTLGAADGYLLTATVAVAAVTAVLRGGVAPGGRYAADALDPDDVVDLLATRGACTVFEVTAGPRGSAVDEGVL
jgi:hypothetical protein